MRKTMDTERRTKNHYRWSIITVLLLVSLLCVACSTNAGATNGSSQADQPGPSATTSGVTNTISTTSNATSGKPVTTFTAIRMLDTLHGWALTTTSILKTSDGGVHWTDVTPSPNPLNSQSDPEFLDAQHAWISISPLLGNPQGQRGGIKILRTMDGGQHWQLTTIHDDQAIGAPRPAFVDTQNGWLEIGTGAAAGSSSLDLFHTTDGGQSWTKIACAGPNCTNGIPFSGQKDIPSFKDTQTGWLTGYTPATDRALFYVTHDAGKTWQYQGIPTIPGMSNVDYNTTPPVLSGNKGVMPVQVNTASVRSLDLYVTSDGGQTWKSTSLAPFSSMNVYALDMGHVWASDGNSLYLTTDAGQHWAKLCDMKNLGAMSFVDAQHGWALQGTYNMPTFLLHTSDGGKSWQKINATVG